MDWGGSVRPVPSGDWSGKPQGRQDVFAPTAWFSSQQENHQLLALAPAQRDNSHNKDNKSS